MKEILCSISTRGRYDTLCMAIQSVIMQTKLPDAIYIYDDNDEPKDLREIGHYHHLFRTMDEKGIEWQVIFGRKLGQAHNHQQANTSGYKWIFRVDDDCVCEPNVLETLYNATDDYVGAVAGSILTPPIPKWSYATGKIENVKTEPNIQWNYIDKVQEVDHLHCSYLYRAGIEDFNLNLSKVAHREETLHTYGIKRKGYKLLVVPCVTWHYRSSNGGIRDGQHELFYHDERIFDSQMNLWNVNTSDTKLCVIDAGLGDHYMFKSILPKLRERHKNITLAVCYPDVFWDEEDIKLISIAEAKSILGNIDEYHPYRKAIDYQHASQFTEVFEKIYLQ